MAKMHSRKRGRSGARRPLKRTKPTWLAIGEKELELLISKLAKEGRTASQIGITLRDAYGVPDVKAALGKSVSDILLEKNILPKVPDDMIALMKKALLIRKHMDTNKHDMPALYGLQLTEAKIKRLVTYYKRIGRIPVDWKYDPTSRLITQ